MLSLVEWLTKGALHPEKPLKPNVHLGRTARPGSGKSRALHRVSPEYLPPPKAHGGRRPSRQVRANQPPTSRKRFPDTAVGPTKVHLLPQRWVHTRA